MNKKDKQFDTILNMDDPNFAENLTKALGVKKGNRINIITPQFERTNGVKITYYPKTEAEFDSLKSLNNQSLKILGCGKWDFVWEKGKSEKKIHWLYPGEWYDFIPEGYEIIGLSGEKNKFSKNESDDDIRYGCLPYGFIGEEIQPKEAPCPDNSK